MRHPNLAVPLLTAALLFGGVTACSEGSGTEVEDGLDVEDEDITPGVDPGEEPVLEEEDEKQ